jgi:hypothetical protein
MAVNLVQKLVDEHTMYQIARAILKAQDIREESWRGKLYQTTHKDAADAACNKIDLSLMWSKYIAHWNYHIWNDIQGWANIVVNDYPNKQRVSPELFDLWDDGDNLFNKGVL